MSGTIVPAQCPHPKSHGAHFWDSADSECLCGGIPTPTGMAAVEEWLHEDDEGHAVEILVTSTGAVYEDDDSAEGCHAVSYGLHYEMKLYETGYYGDVEPDTGDGSFTEYQHIGHGTTLDGAANQALIVMHSHYLSVVAPPRIVQGTGTGMIG